MAGIEYNAVSLAERMDTSLFEVTFIIPDEGTLTETCRHKGFAYKIHPRPQLYSTSLRLGSKYIFNPLAVFVNAVRILFYARKLAGFLQKQDFDLVVTKGLMANFYGGIAARIARCPCVWDMQDVVHKKRALGMYLLILNLSARVTKVSVLAGSKALASQFWGRIWREGRIHIQYNGVDVELYSPDVNGKKVRAEWGVAPEEILVGHCARFAYWKGQLDLIAAASLMRAGDHKIRFVLVGSPVFEDDYFEKKIHAEIQRLGLQDKFLLPGFRKDLPEALAAMDIFVHSSIKPEGCPLAVILAMAAAKPIVATNVMGTNELVTDGQTAILVEPSNPKALGEAMERMIHDAHLRATLSSSARAMAVKEFSLDTYAKGCEKVFWRILFPAMRARPKILFVHGGLKDFVLRDWLILARHFPVSEIDAFQFRWKTLRRLFQEVRKADVLYLWFAGRHSLIPAVLAKMFRKRLIIVAGGWDVANLKEINYGLMRWGWKRRIVRWILAQANRVLCVSHSNQAEAIQNAGVPPAKTTVVYHGFESVGDINLCEKENGLVVTVGEITWSNLKRKGLETFVQTAALVPEAQFCVVGVWVDDSVKHLQRIAAPNVRFAGYLDQDKLHAILRKAKVYVQASYHEAFGCSLAEAMLLGAIPVVTQRFALPEVVGSSGFYAPYGDEKATAQAVIQALRCDAQKGLEARRRILEMFPLFKREEALVQIVSLEI